MDNNEIKDVYSNLLQDGVPNISSDNRFLHVLCRFLPADKESAILDAGCGNGRYSVYLARQGYTNLHGMDLFDKLLYEPPFEYRTANIDQTGYPDQTFDFVFCNSAIYYLKNPSDGFREFYRVLKPGGSLFFTAHTKYSVFTLIRCIKRILCSESVKHLMGVRFNSAYEYEKMLGKIGFRLEWFHGVRLTHHLGAIVRRFCNKPDWKSESLEWGSAFRRFCSLFAYHSVHLVRRPEAMQ